MKDIKTNENVVVEEAPPKVINPEKRRLVILIAVAAALLLATVALILIKFVDFSKEEESTNNGTVQSTGFPYRDTNIADYVNLTEDMVTGLTAPGAHRKPEAITEDYIKTYINQTLLANVQTTEADRTSGNYKVNKTRPVGYGDELALYVLYVTDKDGNRVGEKVFQSAYVDTGFFQIGMEYFGKDFDDKLLENGGLIPKDTGYFEVRTMGSIANTDTVCVSYTVSETVTAADGTTQVKVHKTVTGERRELSLCDEAWTKLLIDNYGTIGQTFSFEYEEDMNDDGKKEKVKYEGVVSSVIIVEEAYALTAKLPDDYFAETLEDKSLVALNGQELIFYINIDFSIDHEANTWETMTREDMSDVLSFTTSTEDLAAARDECLKSIMEDQKAQYKSQEEYLKLLLIWEHILDTVEFTGALPEQALDEVKASAKELIEYNYSSLYSTDELFRETFPNIELYASSVYATSAFSNMVPTVLWEYNSKEYESYEDYIEQVFAPAVVKQNLLAFGIYKNFINNEEELKRRADEYIDNVIASYAAQGKTVTREMLLENNDINTLYDRITVEMVKEYLLSKNSVNYELEKADK